MTPKQIAKKYPNLKALADGRVERGARLADYITLRTEAKDALAAIEALERRITELHDTLQALRETEWVAL